MDRRHVGTAEIIRANSRDLPIADNSVDLVVTSPPYFALRSYQDGGEHYAGQIGDEPTPAEFIDSLLEVTRECVRVLKPSGSLWVNLGDSYAGGDSTPGGASKLQGGTKQRAVQGQRGKRARRSDTRMTREDASWLAGVIDSDGSISVHINKQPEGRSPSFVPWVRVGQMRPEVVTRIAEVTGIGNVMCDGRGVYSWSASAQQARWVLERIHPWLLIKQRQAWAAVEVARHVEARNGRGEYRPLTADDVAYRQRLRDAVLTWNKSGDDSLEVPEPPRVSLPSGPLDPKAKSLRGIPWRYAIRCIDDLGLILRAEVIWSKPNGLPESVTDRVRRSHEQWFHFTLSPRYYSAVDEIREEHGTAPRYAQKATGRHVPGLPAQSNLGAGGSHLTEANYNPLGKLPGSVWTIPTEPLQVPDHLGIDHFAAFPTEWPRRIIQGWCPAGVCVECGEGRRPVSKAQRPALDLAWRERQGRERDGTNGLGGSSLGTPAHLRERVVTGYACACWDSEEAADYITRDDDPMWGRDAPYPAPPTTPGIVLDPFGGTGTTAVVAKALGRHGITVDMSADYCRLAQWRTNDPKQLAKAARREFKPSAEPMEGQGDLLEMLGGEGA